MSESLEKLQNRILSDAKLKTETILRDAEEKASKIVEEAKVRARREAEELLVRARLDAEALKRSTLSTRVRANRLRLLEEKNMMIGTVITAIENSLSSIAQTGNFQDSLKMMVAEAATAIGSDQPILRVGFAGVTRKDLNSMEGTLPRGAKLVIEEKPIDELGGVVATDPEGRVMYNNSFRARLDRMDAELLSVISSTIFGE